MSKVNKYKKKQKCGLAKYLDVNQTVLIKIEFYSGK